MNKEEKNVIGRQGSEEDSVLPEIVEENDSTKEIESGSNCGAPNDFGSFNGRPASSTGKIQMKYRTRAIIPCSWILTVYSCGNHLLNCCVQLKFKGDRQVFSCFGFELTSTIG